MTRYDMMMRGGYSSLEEMDEAYRQEEAGAKQRLAVMRAKEGMKMTEYERGFIDGIKSKVSAELTPTLINVSKTMLEMLKPVLSTALENALNNNAITDTDVQPVDRWINVKDKLPVIGKVVIVCDKQGGVGAMELLSNGQWYRHGMAWSAEWIVYWQPLPEPPKEG